METAALIQRLSEKLISSGVDVKTIQEIQTSIKLASKSPSSLLSLLENLTAKYHIKLDYEMKVLRLMDNTEVEVGSHDAGIVEDIYLDAAVNIFSDKDKGIVKFKEPLTLHQTINLGRAVFDRLSDDRRVLALFVTPSVELEGMITSQIDNHMKDIVLAQASTQRRSGSDEEIPVIRFPILGEQPFPKIKQNVTNYESPFYIYRFESKDKKVYILLSKEKLTPAFYKIKGLVAPLKDETKIGEKAVIGSGIELVIPHTIKSNIKLISKSEFENIVSDWTEDSLMNQIFGKFRHPRSFEHLIGSWLFSGKFQFDLHLGVIAKAGTGKSALLEALDSNFGEIEGIFDGSQGTMKGLVPSYYQTAKEGYYPKCRRIALVDEFFTTLTRGSGGRKPEESDETGLLTSLLEQKLRTGASAKGQLEVHSTAKALFATNPKYGLKTLPEISDKLNRAFLSRILWYVQTDSHIAYVDSRKPYIQGIAHPYPTYNPEFVEVVDYLHDIKLDPDVEKVKEIYSRWMEFVPDNLIEVYEARSMHHIFTLVDGVAKLNYIIQHRTELGITEDDYEEASNLFGMCISSWNVDTVALNKLPPRVRVEFIPIHARQVYNVVDKQPALSLAELNNLIGADVRRTLEKLENLQLVKSFLEDGKKLYFPYWHYKCKDKGDEKNERL